MLSGVTAANVIIYLCACCSPDCISCYKTCPGFIFVGALAIYGFVSTLIPYEPILNNFIPLKL